MEYLSKNIKVRLLLNFISKTTSSMLLPFVTILYAKDFGIVIAGALVGFTSICQILSSIYGGQLTEKKGRIPLMKWGEVSKLACFVILLIYPKSWVLFIMVTIVSIAQGIINPAIDSMLIDGDGNREIKAKILSINNWLYNTSYLIGAIIGGWLFERFLFIIALLLIASSVLILLGIKRYLSETLMPFKGKTKMSALRSYMEVVRNKRFVIFSVGMLLFLFLQRTLTNYIAVNFVNTKVPFTNIILNQSQVLSWVLTLNTVIVILFLPIVTHWFNLKKTNFFLVLSAICLPVGFFILAYLTGFYNILFGTILFSAGELLFTPSMQAVFVRTIGKGNRGPYNAALGMSQSSSKLLSSLFLSISALFTHFENAILLLATGIVGILLVVFSYTENN